MKKLIEIKNVRMKFPVKSGFSDSKNEFIYALNDVSLEIRKGEILGLVGESGCGKSTLGKCVLKLYDNFSGEILYKGQNILKKTGKELKEFRKSAQMIFQNPYASLNPRMTIYDILKEPLLVHGIKDKNEIKKEIDKVCELTGISKDSLKYYPHEFSGGQRQRISIASAIASTSCWYPKGILSGIYLKRLPAKRVGVSRVYSHRLRSPSTHSFPI